ncbi:MAG: nitroreductase family deazaflavin-dependent oxidoreductase [Solirubrobacteraceae bacterium]|nr:nitroreductase family deazaflavin-dependent oxidoreductase [Solirubrobacteraceae bacterium]
MPSDPQLPHIAPDPPRGVQRLIARLLSSRLNGALERSLPFRLIVWRLVPRVMRRGGRLPMLSFAASVLETRDVRNGKPHRRAVVYFHDAGDVILVPSKGGMPTDPHWFENAVADPDVTFGGDAFRAEVVGDAGERERLWEIGDAYYPAYAAYRAHAARSGREIPILRLRPAQVP